MMRDDVALDLGHEHGAAPLEHRGLAHGLGLRAGFSHTVPEPLGVFAGGKVDGRASLFGGLTRQ